MVSPGERHTPSAYVYGSTLGGLPVGSVGLKADRHNPTASIEDRIAGAGVP